MHVGLLIGRSISAWVYWCVGLDQKIWFVQSFKSLKVLD